jgi:hypothetical protein
MYKCPYDRKCQFKTPALGCLFAEEFALVSIHKDNARIKKLLKQCCPQIRNEIIEHEEKVKDNTTFALDFLNNGRIGEKAYCTADIVPVVLLSLPDYEYGDCEYMASDGVVRKAPLFCFNVISKSDKYFDFYTDDADLSDSIELKVHRIGARTEKTSSGNKIKIRIFHDNTKLVREVISMQAKEQKK